MLKYKITTKNFDRASEIVEIFPENKMLLAQNKKGKYFISYENIQKEDHFLIKIGNYIHS